MITSFLSHLLENAVAFQFGVGQGNFGGPEGRPSRTFPHEGNARVLLSIQGRPSEPVRLDHFLGLEKNFLHILCVLRVIMAESAGLHQPCSLKRSFGNKTVPPDPRSDAC